MDVWTSIWRRTSSDCAAGEHVISIRPCTFSEQVNRLPGFESLFVTRQDVINVKYIPKIMQLYELCKVCIFNYMYQFIACVCK